ncbi:hypothetical protein NDA01_30310 [Trichocoleus desertorum AS-A10]|uniref:hypothetical protein n=1 Tax=Trichocoleus desertorum TaxID=1481672 RepID=UPI0032991084
MKKSLFGFTLLALSLSHILNIGVISVQPASAQLYRCSDIALGEDEREEIRGDNSRSESRVTIGQDCDDANYHEYLNERDKINNQWWQQREKASERSACAFFGIDSPRCTDEGLKRQAQQEQAQERRQQEEAARIQQAAQQEAAQEKYFRQRVENAKAEVRSIQESIIFWNDRPDNRRMYELKLPLAEADLQSAEKELQDYLNQKQKR